MNFGTENARVSNMFTFPYLYSLPSEKGGGRKVPANFRSVMPNNKGSYEFFVCQEFTKELSGNYSVYMKIIKLDKTEAN